MQCRDHQVSRVGAAQLSQAKAPAGAGCPRRAAGPARLPLAGAGPGSRRQPAAGQAGGLMMALLGSACRWLREAR